jgi:hypothetical protein
VIEILVHRAGYVFGHEQVAAHQRMRYHVIDKDANLPPIDPAFWLVHYGPSDPENRRPVAGMQINPQIQKLMQERVFLEQQGAVLQRKEFMLMDRSNWPTVNTNIGVQPRAMHPAYQQSPAMARQPVPPGYPPPLAQPPTKRAKLDRTIAQATQNNEIADAIFEEDTEFGDYFDQLTPAEISKMRYKQHHEWMEEIFSSVYSMSQIVPEDLGFGLTGSFKSLTDGILTTPDPLAVLAASDPSKGGEDKGVAVRLQGASTGGYRKLSAEKMDEFERRIQEFVEKGKAGVQAMKQQHAETVAQFNKSKTYMKAERKLRDVDGSNVDSVVQEVEANLHARIVEQKSKVCVEEGGLEKEDKSRVPPPSATNAETASSSNGFSGNGNGSGLFEGGDNSAANLLDEFGGGSYTNSPAARISTPGISQPHSGVPTPGATAGAPENSFMQQAADSTSGGQQSGDDNGVDLLEGMDMDVDMGGVGGEGESEHAKPGAEDDWVMVNDEQQRQSGTPTAEASRPSPTTAQPSTVPAPPQTSEQEAPAMTTAAPAEAVPASTHVEAPTSTDTPNEAGDMFDSAEFGDTFDGLDTAGDALADYGGDDDLGLDLGGAEFDGAFGDADEHHGNA